MLSNTLPFTVITILSCFHVQAQSYDLTQYVLPFTGTAGGGNMFPGVSRPFGVVKLGPDLYTGSDAYSGYLPSGNVTGFTLTHESGTGGAPKYGVVAQQPVVGNVSNPLSDQSTPRASNDEAQVGYYKSSLSSGVTVELAATEHAGILQHTFPTGSTANVLVDVSHVLPSFRGLGLGQNYTGGNITIDPDGHYEGSGTYNNGWNLAPEWTIYFCGYFDTKPTSIQTFRGTGTTASQYPAESTEAVPATSDGSTQSIRLGVVYTFSNTTVLSRVGVSFISSAQACSNVEREIPSGTEIQSVVEATKQVWNTDVLSKVTTSETNQTNLQLLYTMLYGMHLLPTNKTGENPLWTSTEPYYDDIFTLWDLFRCHTPLFHIFQPEHYEAYIRSLIDVYRNVGWMPDARSSNFNGRSQGGSNADNVLADAYVKGVRGAVNWNDGYAAMVKDAEVQPPNLPVDPEAPESSDHEGRGALPDWLKYGFITPSYTRSVSRASEYALNDFALSQVASGLSNPTDAFKYLSRSRNWRNHYNPALTSLNYTGFFAPKNSNGTFVSINPLSCGGCYWGDYFYEALPWEYTFSPYHDIATLVNYTGGASAFAQKLDTLFTPGLNPDNNAQFGNTIFNPGNEPSFASPYLFNFAGRQDLSVERSRNIATAYYAPTPSGLPGNSDAGAMQSWLLWNMIGLYPLTGTTTFLIGASWFPELVIDLGGGKTLNVTGGSTVPGASFVQELKVNGVAWDKAWVSWGDVFEKGGTMEFVLGTERKAWAAVGELPPSPAAGEYEGTGTAGTTPADDGKVNG